MASLLGTCASYNMNLFDFIAYETIESELVREQFFKKFPSVHTTPGKFENATISGHLRFVLEENTVREITGLE